MKLGTSTRVAVPPVSPIAGHRRGRTVLCLVATVMVSLPLAVVTSPAHASTAGTPNTWQSVPNLNQARIWAAAATGPDDRVYVAGGQASDGGAAFATVEAYDPAQPTEPWTDPAGPAEKAIKPMNMARAKHALVTNGQRIFAIGGEDPLSLSSPSSLAVGATVETYDPLADTWERVAPMSVPRPGVAAVSAPCPFKIAAACVYAIGGKTNTVEVYNPATRVWAPVAPMAKARSNFGAAVGADGRIYAVGGAASSTADLKSVEAYDPARPDLGWVAVASMPHPREGVVRAVADRVGRIYVLGGYWEVAGLSNPHFRTVDVYDPHTNEWTPPVPAGTLRSTWPASMNTDRHWGTAAALGPEGRIYAAGGGNPSPLASVEAYTQPKYLPATPVRTLDTRSGQVPDDGIDAPLGSEETVAVQISGRHGVPIASEVEAVVLNVTATQPTTSGHLRVFPADQPLPNASNLNFAAGQTVANLVIAKLSPPTTQDPVGGKIKIYNRTGTTHVFADVAGWFPVGSDYVPATPVRTLDSRDGPNTVTDDGVDAPLSPDGTVEVQISGRHRVPARGVAAVVLNVTAIGPTTPGHLRVFPADEPMPTASNLNFAAGQTVANLVVAKLSGPTAQDPGGGKIKIYNKAGTTHVAADVAGWFPAGSEYSALTPARIFDTRPTALPPLDGDGLNQAMANEQIAEVQVAGWGEVPTEGAGAVVLNVTATQPTAAGHLRVFPGDQITPPLASNLNFAAGQTVPNLVIARLSPQGTVKIYSRLSDPAGTTQVFVDVAGWFPA